MRTPGQTLPLTERGLFRIMRKIEREMINAIANGKEWQKDNTMVCWGINSTGPKVGEGGG